MRTSMTSTRSKVKVTELPKLQKVHFSRSISFAILTWAFELPTVSEAVLAGGDDRSPLAGLSGLLNSFTVRRSSKCLVK